MEALIWAAVVLAAYATSVLLNRALNEGGTA